MKFNEVKLRIQTKETVIHIHMCVWEQMKYFCNGQENLASIGYKMSDLDLVTSIFGIVYMVEV